MGRKKGVENAANFYRGGRDMMENGVTLSNAVQVASGGLGLAGNASGLKGAGRTNCFTEGTQIVVGAEYDEDGIFVQYITVGIEDIKVGDYVYSYNTLTGEIELSEVTSTVALTSYHVNYLTFLGEDGSLQTIETTDAHPFWVVIDDPDMARAARNLVDENGTILYHENLEPGLNGYWVEAKDLRVGDVFLGANGELSTLTDITRVEQSGGIAVFNFTVEGNHNYFILAKNYEYAQSCVLVHNVDCFRAMKTDANGDPLVENSARGLGVRITGDIIDIPVDPNGMVHPETGGLSVAVDTPMNLPQHRRPPEFGGTGKDSVFHYDTNNLPPELQFRQDTPTHGLIEPSKPMKISVFEDLLTGTKPDWN